MTEAEADIDDFSLEKKKKKKKKTPFDDLEAATATGFEVPLNGLLNLTQCQSRR